MEYISRTSRTLNNLNAELKIRVETLYPRANRLEWKCVKEYKIPDSDVTIVNDQIVVHPEKFYPERFSQANKAERHPYSYLAFRMGPRNCIVPVPAAAANYRFVPLPPCTRPILANCPCSTTPRPTRPRSSVAEGSPPRRKRPAPRPKGLSGSGDFEEMEKNEEDFDTPFEDEDDGNLSELSLPVSSEEEEADKDKAEGGDREKGNLKDKEELPEEEARKRRLEYILKRSEFYTKKLTAGGIGGLTSGGKVATANLNSTAGSRRRSLAPSTTDDEDLMDSRTSSSKGPVIFDTSPGFITGGKMRDHQVRGLNWLVSLYDHGINGILADEMGLGKTLQSISVLGYLKHVKGLKYHALIIVPKSTLSNWINEIQRWCPTIRALAMIGDEVSRQKLINEGLKKLKNWDVLVTTYEMVLMEKAVLQKIHWGYLIIDEAHRIKNEQSLLAKVVRTLRSSHRLLLTGTPLQNNLHELWSLLNFVLPKYFSSSEDFSSWFAEIGAESEELVKRLHTILRPFLLRRLKSEVEKGLPPKIEKKIYVGLSQMQHQCYRDILLNQFSELNSEGNMSHQSLAHIVLQLQKCCNHPYLFRGQEPGPPYTCEPHLFTNCGKMLVMDKLLEKLKQEGSRVLLFSSMARMLDIFEDYCFLKKMKYHRLDGSTEYTERQKMIDEFNSPGIKFCGERDVPLHADHAGGLGINLTSADCVVIYDSDWNPMVDLQAMDRAHRIGQTKQVRVFRLITEDTVEEKIVQRAALKLKLDNVVIQQGRGQIVDKSQNVLSSADLLSWVRHSAKSILSSDGVETIADETIQEIMSKSEAKSGKVDEAINALPESRLATFTIDSQAQEKDHFDFGGGEISGDQNITGSQRASKLKALAAISGKPNEGTPAADAREMSSVGGGGTNGGGGGDDEKMEEDDDSGEPVQNPVITNNNNEANGDDKEDDDDDEGDMSHSRFDDYDMLSSVEEMNNGDGHYDVGTGNGFNAAANFTDDDLRADLENCRLHEETDSDSLHVISSGPSSCNTVYGEDNTSDISSQSAPMSVPPPPSSVGGGIFDHGQAGSSDVMNNSHQRSSSSCSGGPPSVQTFPQPGSNSNSSCMMATTSGGGGSGTMASSPFQPSPSGVMTSSNNSPPNQVGLGPVLVMPTNPQQQQQQIQSPVGSGNGGGHNGVVVMHEHGQQQNNNNLYQQQQNSSHYSEHAQEQQQQRLHASQPSPSPQTIKRCIRWVKTEVLRLSLKK
ncbi:SWI/SNF-related matrix-associated actin-dependent regulator of chromatin subfamily A member 5 [Folsomia candida]|uniref:SWI/SNF-related matrix-associated actin-dependent regulator of chromatin subfamily A member 5 n=2 Tax=Folsomia candida TaxID=158441 RepID=A0A226CVH7_FOLCA|nr:SWI/SNF-related matrix-associated actin-dependent regulator of chromatin subfamily A member 5 [Folsomia candida]